MSAQDFPLSDVGSLKSLFFHNRYESVGSRVQLRNPLEMNLHKFDRRY